MKRLRFEATAVARCFKETIDDRPATECLPEYPKENGSLKKVRNDHHWNRSERGQILEALEKHRRRAGGDIGSKTTCGLEAGDAILPYEEAGKAGRRNQGRGMKEVALTESARVAEKGNRQMDRRLRLPLRHLLTLPTSMEFGVESMIVEILPEVLDIAFHFPDILLYQKDFRF